MKKIKLRFFVQLFFFILIAVISISKTLAESGIGFSFFSDISLHAICPFGGVVTLYNLATLGVFIKKIHMSSVILMTIIFVLAVTFGPVFCGWVCPLGSFQEWIGALGKRIFKKRFNHFIPEKADKIMRYARYFVLAWVVFVTAKSGYLIFEKIDPYNALFTFWSEEVSIQALIILLIIIFLSFFIERPWCKYACPYGALLGISNKFRIFKIKRNSETCIHCKKCTNSCPMNIPVSEKTAVKDLQCISCFECTSERACPVLDTVTMETSLLKKKRKVNIITTSILIFVLIFGGIGFTIAIDLWTTSSTKVPSKIKTSDNREVYNPSDIRGSYTFSEVAELFEININILYEAFGIPATTDSTSIKTKDLEGLYSNLSNPIGNESVQIFVALYKNLPIELDDTFLPDKAVALILKENANLTATQKDYLAAHRISLEASTSNATGEKTTATTKASSDEPLVNSSTTFQALLDAGITKAQIEEIIKSAMPPTNQTVKSYCTEKGISFSEIKTKLNDLIK